MTRIVNLNYLKKLSTCLKLLLNMDCPIYANPGLPLYLGLVGIHSQEHGLVHGLQTLPIQQFSWHKFPTTAGERIQQMMLKLPKYRIYPSTNHYFHIFRSCFTFS